MARKLSKEQMIQAVKNQKYYIAHYKSSDDYTLCGMRKDGSFSGSEVYITKERAQEWIDCGIDVDEM